MQYVTIKREEKDGREFYIVNAIPLKNTKNTIVQKIPHPLGSDVLSYDSLEDAKEAVIRAGFSYILPNGEKGSKSQVPHAKNTPASDYSQVVYESVKSKINSSNSNVAAAAILAVCEFPIEETFDILFDKIGEDNDLIRKNAISGICRYSNILQDRIIESLKSSNWVVRNSALSCILNLAESSNPDIEKFILPLTEICDDSNTIVQANAILTLAKVYQSYQKNKKF